MNIIIENTLKKIENYYIFRTDFIQYRCYNYKNRKIEYKSKGIFMKNKIRCLVISLLISLVFISCATTVDVKITRPANLDLNGAKTIAVLPIKPYAYYKNSNTSIGKKILITSFYQLFDISDPDEQLAIDSLQTQIEKGLLDSPYINIVSSSSVENAISKGLLNPADVYLTGEVTYFDVDDEKSEERKQVKAAKGDQKAEYKIETRWRRTVTMNFRYQVVDSLTEQVISYNEMRLQNNSSKYDTKRSLPDAYSIIESDLRTASRKILQELQPYVVTKSIKLLKIKTKDNDLKARVKAADELANNNKIKEASDRFQDIYEDTGIVEAGYNAAILQEALGNLSVAERMMIEVYDANPDSRVAKGLTDIRNEIGMANRLKNQIQSSDDDDFDDLDF